MSLTRAQWIEMWESAKEIENLADTIARPYATRALIRDRANFIIDETKKIKEQIQSVIGQME